MKKHYSASGIYFPIKNEKGQTVPVCFEDLEREEQLEILNSETIDRLKNLSIELADRLYDLVAMEPF